MKKQDNVLQTPSSVSSKMSQNQFTLNDLVIKEEDVNIDTDNKLYEMNYKLSDTQRDIRKQ